MADWIEFLPLGIFVVEAAVIDIAALDRKNAVCPDEHFQTLETAYEVSFGTDFHSGVSGCSHRLRSRTPVGVTKPRPNTLPLGKERSPS